ncbi:chromosome segregation ATPase [Paenibacillus sp. SYP-B3998]|uniref:Chromosome segregation ATPase n=1 Tax=Paenibacillus sp. SYP-B3998 TaxID=2678564 RepID=A0A6G4A6J2_9BACL|nr:chromosome segregation ATPase [Paenibacillus sp. SYP-B3998]NEW09918.1 chromosome segregation ATPase [Paenibacillus sp. SYP-B3998]
MPAISKIRFTNVVYEEGNKRYNDELFHFDGHNGAILLENGGGKTVFIQTAIQAVLPHTDLAGRKMKDTLSLENGPAHIAIEWILNERPRRYVVTCVSLFLTATGMDSYRYTYDYAALDADSIDQLPFVKESAGKLRAADKGEIHDYYQSMTSKRMNAKLPPTIKEYKQLLEKDYHIIASEWDRIAKINSSEGGVESFFDECKTTSQLFDRLLIPTVEDAMSGYEQGEFADTFESHRDSFRRYRELKEKIEENKKILSELDRYVGFFAKLDAKQQEYAASQAEAKSYWLLSNEQKEEETAKLSQFRNQIAACEQKLLLLAQKRDSLHIAKQNQERATLETKLNLVEEDMGRTEAKVRATKRLYYSLRLAEYKQQWKQAEERMNYLKQELDQFGSTKEEDDLQEAWKSNSGQIRSLFETIEQEWQAEEEKLKQEMASYEDRKSLEEIVLVELSGQLEDLNKRIIENRSIVEAREKDRESLRKHVLANPAVESMEGSMTGWVQRYQRLDESNVLLVQKNKDLAASKDTSSKDLERISEALKQQYAVCASSEHSLEAFKEAHQAVRSELAAYRPSWARLTFIYDKQSSIEEQLIEDMEKRRQEKETYLQKERLAFRYIDDYRNQDMFFADIYVAGLLEKWKNQFSLLESGIQYLQGVGLPHRAAMHPLWSVTLITTEGEVSSVANKLRQYAEDMQFPIQVISSQEASRLANLDAPIAEAEKAWIEPQHWRENVDAVEFANWKQTIYQKGEEVLSTRKAKEEELKHTSDRHASFHRFLTLYPLETVQEIEKQVGQNRERVRLLEEEKEVCKKSIRQDEMSMDQQSQIIDEQKDEMVQLQQWIEKGHNYLALGKEIDVLSKANDQLVEQSEVIQSKVNSRQRGIEHMESTMESTKARLLYLKLEKATLQGQELYAELMDTLPIQPKQSLDWLKTERRDLHLKLNHISQGRQQLEINWSHAKNSKMTLEREMNKLQQEHGDLQLNDALAFSTTGEEQMVELLKEQKEQEAQLSRVRSEFARMEKQFDAQETRVKLLVEQYTEAHSGQQPAVFLEALHVIEEQVQSEDTRLKEEQQGLMRMQTQIMGQLTTIEEVLHYLNQYKIMHGFENPRVLALLITQEAKVEFLYDRMGIVKNVLAKLSAHTESLEAEENTVKKAKGQFIDFCRKHIKDVKLREMAEQGVEQKNNFEDMTVFQQKMNSRIERVNHIAEETMRTHNQQLEQYIVHVHSHLKLIASELRDIPNKTRVKVEDQWKLIYSFHIPEWDELEAKEYLRKHLEWILTELEKGQYRDDNGQEFKSTVRKEIEKWLDTKQLLHIVLQERPMKVSCRKVTNENNVTKASFSWEQSNNWSGGEKWSKNMTLFLGLLNYVAEKRQHIQAHMKRHRTVILDNPFGKASSDHVLNPVFFIAEQLGFQIIALTAHAEGKFLKDYFPVVFSCRLRQAANGNKQVMTKEKEINQAYFRDHAPVSLERLGDVKQLELFV